MRADRLFTSIYPAIGLIAFALLAVGLVAGADVLACERTHLRAVCLKMVGG